jgi:hypothetical protein
MTPRASRERGTVVRPAGFRTTLLESSASPTKAPPRPRTRTLSEPKGDSQAVVSWPCTRPLGRTSTKPAIMQKRLGLAMVSPPWVDDRHPLRQSLLLAGD